MLTKLFHSFDKEGFIETDLKFYQFLTFSDSLRRSHNQLPFSTALLATHTHTKNGRNGNGTDSPYHFYRNTVKVLATVYPAEHS